VEVGFDSFDSLFGVDGSYRCNDHSLKTFLLQHLVVIFVESYSKWFKMCLGPLDLSVIWGAGCDQFGARCPIQKVQRMSFAHATKAGAGNSQLFRSHYNLLLG
jgi:hypothetical protein